MAMRLLCDEMFARLARLLRAAGHDTVLSEPGTADTVLLESARAEGRLLLTRDRRLAERAGSAGLLLPGDGVEDQALGLGAQTGLNWLSAPFTRCLVDNTLLRPASEAEVSIMPPSVRNLPGPFNACPCCGRLFWPGSHVKRLRAVLEDLQSRRGAAADEPNAAQA